MSAPRDLLNVINSVKTQLVATIALVMDLGIDCRTITLLVSVSWQLDYYCSKIIQRYRY
jgi:hypothetical protein